MMKNKCLICASLSLLLAGCATTQKTTMEDLYSNISLDAGFDTVLYYQEYNADAEASKAHFEEAVSLFSHYNELFDIYNDYEGVANIKTINDFAGISPVVVDPAIIEMLNEAKTFTEMSDEEFDVTIGSLLKVWHNYREEGQALNEEGKSGNVPSDGELEEASRFKGWDKVIIDEDASTVYITDPNVSLDVGGIAKGFATEKIAETLAEKEDIGTVVINAGGNNRTIHTKPDGSPWRVSIQNPDGGNSFLTVSAKDSVSFVTSGDYERYYIAEDGTRYHHIIDPDTLFPADLYRSVTIITKDSGAADCLSTALFTVSVEEGKKILETYEAETGETADAIWIMDKDKADSTTDGIDHQNFKIVATDNIKDNIAISIN